METILKLYWYQFYFLVEVKKNLFNQKEKAEKKFNKFCGFSRDLEVYLGKVKKYKSSNFDLSWDKKASPTICVGPLEKIRNMLIFIRTAPFLKPESLKMLGKFYKIKVKLFETYIYQNKFLTKIFFLFDTKEELLIYSRQDNIYLYFKIKNPLKVALCTMSIFLKLGSL
jgi:hypothetical protein